MAGSDTSKEADELADACEAFEAATEAWSDNYNEALDDFRFSRLHEHWPEKIKKQRQLDGRPCLTIPKLPAFIRQVVNDARQNKPGIVTQPVDSAGDPETAEIINGLIRHIERASHADVAYDTALEHAVTGGFGWLKVNTIYANDDGFEQDIVIEQVANAFSILPDPDSTAADSSDWMSAFEVAELSKKAFERRFDGADPISFDGGTSTSRKPVSDGDQVQYVVQWVREETRRSIVAVSPPGEEAPEDALMAASGLLNERLVIDLAVYEKNKDLFDALGVKVIGRPRDVPSWKVCQKLFSGAEKLEQIDWAGKYIPIIPVYGEDINIEGRRYLAGLVRAAKDEQRRYNFEISAATEASGLAPKAPYVGPVGAFETDKAKWATANTANHPYIEFDTVDAEGKPISGAPQRQPMSGVPIAQMQLALSASDNLKAIMGLYDASLGQRSNETSGRAINARKAEGDTSTFHFVDNLTRAMRHAGEVIVDLIPKVYSTPRVVRVLGPDAKEARPVKVNQPFREPEVDAAGKPVMETDATGQQRQREIERIYRLDVGKYDVTVRAGPSFTTQREEFVALATEIIRAYPQAAPILADLIVKNYDIPEAEEIVKRFEALLPAQLQGESPEAQALKAQVQKLLEVLGQAKAEIATLKQDRQIDAFNAETNRLKAITGKDGAGFDPVQMAPVVMQSLLQIMQSPDILEMAASGAPPEQLMAAMQQRMAPPAAEPPMAA